MSKTYDLSKKSDLNRFEKDLEKAIIDKANETILNGHEFDFECPNCHNQIKIHVGNNVCPFCKFEIKATLGQK